METAGFDRSAWQCRVSVDGAMLPYKDRGSQVRLRMRARLAGAGRVAQPEQPVTWEGSVVGFGCFLSG